MLVYLYIITKGIVIEQAVIICSKQVVKEIDFGILTQWLLGSGKKNFLLNYCLSD